MLPDVVLGCLDKAMPGRPPAEGSSSLWNPMLSGGHGLVVERAAVLESLEDIVVDRVVVPVADPSTQ